MLFATPAAAQWAASDLFPNPPVPTQAGPHGLDSLAGVLDTAPVARGLGRLRLQLPGGGTVEFARDGFERRKDGDVTWRGSVTTDEGSRVILTVKDGYMAGRILHGIDEYEIRPGPGRSHIVERVDTSVEPVEELLEPPVDYSADIGPVYEPGGYSPNYGNSPDNIQLLVAYSLDALAAAGGEPQIEVRIQSMVDQLNTAFIDSGMIARVALVQTLAVDYNDSGNVLTDLDWLTTRHEMINFEVHAQREFYGADLVSMIVDNGGQCSGVAYLMSKPAYDFVSYAYSVSALNCGGGGLAHEIGHNMGFEHNPEDSARFLAGQPTATPFSFGHYVDGSFRTIMSYSTPCLSGCPMAFRFSNPNLDFLGSPTGIADERDNAQTGDYTAPIVADFFDAVTGALVNRRVSASVEDVEEMVDGSVVFDSATLELGDGLAGVQAVGLRFQNLNIPVGMRIDSAYLEFEAADIGSDVTSVQISAEAADNALPFSATPFDVTWRPATTASVQWDLPAWGTVTEKHYSPDISAIIQEVVDRPGWLENNSMVLTVGGTGIRTALAHDGNAASAPLLHVEYASPFRPASISAPVVAFSYTCTGLTCSFTDESTDSDGIIVYWSWHFGGGIISYAQNPTYTLPAEGTYFVSLEIRDDQSWQDYTEKQIIVTVGNSPPVAVDDAYTTTVDTPVSGNVLTDGTPDSDVNGDTLTVTSNTSPSNGAASVGANGDFTYTPTAGFAGSDSFTYTITDGNGGSATATVSITVRTNVVATDNAYTTTEDTALTGNVLTDGTPDSDIDGDPLTVTANTNPANGTVTVAAGGAFTYTPSTGYTGTDSFTYTVSDGNGNSATAAVNITVYIGNYPPVAAFYFNCADLSCDFADGLTDAEGPISSWSWSFGDGAISTVPNPTHIYTAEGYYTVTLMVTDAAGATGTVSQTVTVNAPPVAAFSYSCADLICGFTDGSSDAGGIVSWSWSFGDGATSTAQSPTHRYTADGTYTVTLTVTDPVGATNTASQAVTVANTAPIAGFSVSCADLYCSFTNDSTDADGLYTSRWLFGDGAFWNGSYSPHHYLADGTYTVTLTVTDRDGATDTTSQMITIANTPPTASFSVNCTGLQCNFTDDSTDVDRIRFWLWSFGDGTIMELNWALPKPSFTYSYKTLGFYTLSLQVTDRDGVTDTISQKITVTDTVPVAGFGVNCVGLNCGFTDGSVAPDGIASWAWSFGDGTTSTVQSPTHSFVSDGTYTIALTITDTIGATDTASQTVTVAQTGPVATGDSFIISEDTVLKGNVITAGVADSDADGDVLTVTANTDPTSGTLTVAANGAFTYTPSTNFNGFDSFTYTISDGNGGVATATVTITVRPINDPPVANFDYSCIGLSCSFKDLSTDVDGTITNWWWTKDFPDVFAFGITANFTYSFDAYGTYRIYLKVTDSDGVTNTGWRDITTDSTPVATDNAYSTVENTSVSGNVLTDGVPDSDNGTYFGVTANTVPLNGAVTIAWDGAFTYTPNTGFVGTDSFIYTVSDQYTSATATVTITTVNPINTAPVATADAYTTNEDVVVSGNVLLDGTPDSDIDGDSLTVTANSSPTNGTVTVAADGAFTYTPNANFNGADGFDYTISDGNGGAASATVTITVSLVNDGPVATDNTYTTGEDTPVGGNVITDGIPDSDIDGDALTVTASSSPANGTATVAADGAFTYTPNGDFNGSDSFTYTIGDGNGGSDTAAVSFTVNPVNDAPVATANSYTGNQDTRVIGNFLTDGIPDSDAEGDILTIVGATTPASGRVRMRENGKFRYRPNAGFTGTDSFDYTISDGKGGSATATVTITIMATATVNPANNAPVATANSYTTVTNTYIIGNVLTDGTPDSDADGDVLTVVGKSKPAFGWLYVFPGGKFIYYPNSGFTGTDSFTYTISDGNGGSATATATIMVTSGR